MLSLIGSDRVYCTESSHMWNLSDETVNFPNTITPMSSVFFRLVSFLFFLLSFY